MSLKTCRICTKELDINAFYQINNNGKLYQSSYCIPCYRLRQKSKYSHVDKKKNIGMSQLTAEDRKFLYDGIKAGKSLRELRKENATLRSMVYGTLYLNTKPDKLEKLIS
jgi:hypothetical protein